MRSFVFLAALSLTIGACATTGDVAESVSVEGVFSFQREVTISNPKVAGDMKSIEKYDCINGLYGPGMLTSEEISLFDNENVLVSGKLLNYLEYMLDDPIDGTVSHLENRCNAKFFVLIERIELRH